MKYAVCLEKENYALIARGENLDEYAVVYGLNKETGAWAHTVGYWNFGKYSRLSETAALFRALELFEAKTNDDYISINRVVELATLFKDKLLEDDEESALEYFKEDCYMSEKELRFFGIESEDE